jgi:penicillin-binding protein 1C
MAIKAYVGSADFNDNTRFGHIDMVAAVRSPGSTLKPFIYALAIDEGIIHSESLLIDAPRLSDYSPTNFNASFSGAVSASQSLERSLNLPAVQLIEAYGPKRFAAKLANAGINLKFPQAAEPNLATILGGVGISLDSLVSAYSVFAKGGQTSPLRFLKSDSLISRPFVDSGAAWITRRMLSGEADPSFYRRGFLSLAYKTGTSYGLRDAWAVGISSKYIIGVWVGRPDGAPVPEQIGALSAMPLLYQINNHLSSRNTNSFLQNDYLDEKPDGVSVEKICWPSGQTLPEGDVNCRAKREAWIFNDQIPPPLLFSKEDSQGGWYTYYIDDKNETVGFECPNAVRKRLAVWPAALNPWLDKSERVSARLPPKSRVCLPSEDGGFVRTLLIKNVKNGAIFTRSGDKEEIAPLISSQGGRGMRWWFLNGTMIAQNDENEFLNFTLRENGAYQLVVIDESGQSDKAEFSVIGF